MPREIIVELIQKKRELYQQEHDAESEKSVIEEKYSFADEGSFEERDREINAIESRLNSISEKIVQAHFFGLKHAKGRLARCVHCFVERGELPDMQLITSNTSMYKCTGCGHEIMVEV